MASLTIKGIPDVLLEHLRRRAEQHRRSLNSEVIHLLERSVASTPVAVDEVLARIQHLQDRTQLPPLTKRSLEKAVNEGRP